MMVSTRRGVKEGVFSTLELSPGKQGPRLLLRNQDGSDKLANGSNQRAPRATGPELMATWNVLTQDGSVELLARQRARHH